MELIYIIGKRNGTPRSIFTDAEMQLRKMGFVAVNPLEEILKFNEFDEEGLNSAEEEAAFLYPFLQRSSGVYLLKGWEESQVAKSEIEKAQRLGLKVMHQAVQISVEDIIKAAEEVTGKPMEQLKARSRKNNLVEIRMAIFYLAWKYQSTTAVALGQLFGRDHTTVLSAKNRAQMLMESGDERAMEIINQIKNRLTA